MDPSERVETDSLVDLQVSIADGDVSMNVEAVGEPQEDGSVAGSGDGMQQEAETKHNEPPRRTSLVRSADAHFEQVTGNGQVAELSGPLVGSIPGSVEASATLSIRNPVPVATSPVRHSYVSGAHDCGRLAPVATLVADTEVVVTVSPDVHDVTVYMRIRLDDGIVVDIYQFPAAKPS